MIPVFNRESRVSACIDSVLQQNLKPREVIVVDDGSTDGTRKELASFGDAIKVILSKQNRGVSWARNHGVALAKGQWIAFVDSDDRWDKNKLLKQWQFLKEQPFYQILQCDEIWIRNGVRVNSCKYHKKSGGWIWEHSLARCMVSPSAVLLKKELFEQSGGFDEQLRACEDYDLWLQLTRHLPVGLEPSLSLTKYGGHEDQLSRHYPAMDRFRLYALIKALRREPVQAYREKLIDTIVQKIGVLKGGCFKRGRQQEGLFYDALLRQLSSLWQVELSRFLSQEGLQ